MCEKLKRIINTPSPEYNGINSLNYLLLLQSIAYQTLRIIYLFDIHPANQNILLDTLVKRRHTSGVSTVTWGEWRMCLATFVQHREPWNFN